MIPIVTKSDGIQFRICVLPRSAKNAIAGVYGDALKIKLTAAPVEGAANAMCVKFLAKCLQVPKSAVEITTGHTSRHKTVHIATESTTADPSETIALAQRLRSLIKS